MVTLCQQMQSYYPHQEFARETIDSFLFDLERLAVTYGLDRLQQAFLNIRLRRGQKFFPHPTEVLDEIEANVEADQHAKAMEQQLSGRQKEIADFWRTAPEWMEITGYTEEQMIERFPSFKGTKPGQIHVVNRGGKSSTA